MIRATTPRHEFIFEDDPSTFDKILITYTQSGRIILEKTESDMTFDNIEENGKVTYVGWLRLTQEETNRFSTQIQAKVQVRALTNSGNAYASQIFSINIGQVLNDSVISDE